MCGATSESTLSHTTRCSIRATRASVAGRARDPRYLGKPSARGGGAAPGRPNAGCTRSPSSVGRRAVSGDLMTIPPHGGTLVQRLVGEDERAAAPGLVTRLPSLPLDPPGGADVGVIPRG